MGTNPRQEPETTMSIDQYGPKEACNRLEKEGYHPLVTTKSVRQILEDFKAKHDENENRATSRLEFIIDNQGRATHFQGIYVDSGNLVIDMTSYIMTKKANMYVTKDASPLVGVFDGDQTFGLIIGKMMAAQGMKQLENFAVDKNQRLWAKLARGIAIWNFLDASYHGEMTGSAVFICVHPTGSMAQLKKENERSAKIISDEVACRDNILKLVVAIRQYLGTTHPDACDDQGENNQMVHIANGYHCPKDIVKMAQAIPAVADGDILEAFAKAVDPNPTQDYCMSKQVALFQTMKLLTAIARRSNLIEVLHFHKTPLLDRKLIAIILRACPHVKMLGIYECPMLHLGDVVFLLDLIREVNLERDRQHLPRVESLDFYPRYHAGMPYKSKNEFESYGFSWKPKDNDIAQRGVLTIVMLAVLKSRHMKVKLLMDRDAAFMTYLLNLPMVPGKICAFLDGLYRFLDLKEKRSKDVNAIKQAMYDLLKAVRSGLQPLKNDWVKYYIHKMGESFAFCCSCGYEFLPEFFDNGEIGNRPERRTCSACILRYQMDNEMDHLKQPTMNIMAGFYPDWRPHAFNVNAPLLEQGHDLAHFKTAKAEADPNPQIILPNGEIYWAQREEPLLRNRKCHFDSVQGLPTLATLLNATVEQQLDARDAALFVDARRTLSLMWGFCYPGVLWINPPPTLAGMISARGCPDHYDEDQGPRFSRKPKDNQGMRISHTFASAIEQYNNNLGEPFKKEVFDFDEEAQPKNYWTPDGKVSDDFW
ncbi:hypothetical protein FIE12Z_4583 [Fusarium flagelliforme]|uniref:Uncharacterized protein n=2 Tax=Fusarium flagelliforme TaxID=2675880 RepID=A0A395MTM7_9HYPO|nr:hypothetical protein FIE12Z_4583 [Fusarium flagelliforme]